MRDNLGGPSRDPSHDGFAGPRHPAILSRWNSTVAAFYLAVGIVLLTIAAAALPQLMRLAGDRAMERPLARFGARMEKNAAETTGWIVGIIGFLLARAAAVELGLFDRLG